MPTPFEVAYTAYREWIGMNGGPNHQRSHRGRPPKRMKVVVAGDFHVPFHNREALKVLIREESRDTDLLVTNGDLLDCWSTSRFPKSTRLVDPCREMAEGQAVLNILAEHFRRIRIIGGNHDARPQKFLTDHLPPEVLDYINLTGPQVFRPLEFLSAGLDNVEIVQPIQFQNAEFGFLYQLGDLVCAHAESFSKIPNRAATNVNQWIHSFAIPAGVLRDPVRCVIQAHTHQAGTVLGDFGTLCIEGGCMSTLQEYHGSAKIQTPRPLAIGWSVIYQERGRTNHRDTRFRPFTA